MFTFKAIESFKPGNESSTDQAPYILCNEQNQQDTLKAIAAMKLPSVLSNEKISAHVGFSVWFNLDLLTVNNAAFAIILDIDPKVYAIYDILKKALSTSDDPATFVKQFLSAIETDKRNLSPFLPDHQKSLFEQEMQKSYGFLSSKESFLHVKRLLTEGRLFFGCADMLNTQQMQQILNCCEQNNAEIKTLYLSNIPEWILEYTNQKDTLVANLLLLKKHSPIVLDAFYPTKKKSGFGPPLRITEGEIPNFNKTKEIRNGNPFFRNQADTAELEAPLPPKKTRRLF